MKFSIRVDGTVHEVIAIRRSDSVEVRVGDLATTYQIIEQDGDRLVLSYNGRRFHLSTAALGEQRQVWHDGQLLTYERIEKRRDSSDDVDGSLAAAIPSVVAEVLVTVGEQVDAGQKLILLESMKMVIPITAPKSGTVTAILCAAGDAVDPGVPLLNLEEENADE